jgi:hypothetical protein
MAKLRIIPGDVGVPLQYAKFYRVRVDAVWVQNLQEVSGDKKGSMSEALWIYCPCAASWFFDTIIVWMSSSLISSSVSSYTMKLLILSIVMLLLLVYLLTYIYFTDMCMWLAFKIKKRRV